MRCPICFSPAGGRAPGGGWHDGVTVGSEVIEIKRTLDGAERTFRCTLMGLGPRWAALRYVIPAPATVGTLTLPAGSETIAHYWVDRPYTAYHWIDAAGQTLGVYLNAATDIEIGPGAVRWRDLALDVLVRADGRIEVLDEDEARQAPEWARSLIEAARTQIVPGATQIASEVAALTQAVRTPRPARSQWEGSSS